MKPVLVLALVGKKCSGKDTVFGTFSQCAIRDGVRASRFAFADALKAEVAEAFGTTVEAINRDKEQYRLLLQAWGEARRNIVGKDYWINKVSELMSTSDSELAVITDCRYLNESTFVSSINGLKVGVIRENQDRADRHSSEIELELIETDLDLYNSTDLTALAAEATDFWDTMIRPILNERLCIHSVTRGE